MPLTREIQRDSVGFDYFFKLRETQKILIVSLNSEKLREILIFSKNLREVFTRSRMRSVNLVSIFFSKELYFLILSAYL